MIADDARPPKKGRRAYVPNDDPYDPAIGILPNKELRRLLRKWIVKRENSTGKYGRNIERNGELTLIEFQKQANITNEVLANLLYGMKNARPVGPSRRKRVSQLLLKLESGLIERKIEFDPHAHARPITATIVIHDEPTRKLPITRKVVFMKFSNRENERRILPGEPMFHVKHTPRTMVIPGDPPPQPRKILKWL